MSSSSRFYTYLSYLIILLIPAYIIYQGVYHNAPEKITTTETVSESVSSAEPQKTATTIIKAQVDEVTFSETDSSEKELEDNLVTDHTS